MQAKDHWEEVYSRKAADAVSWYQEHADRSLRLIRETGIGKAEPIIDVGGGASTLVDDLVEDGYSDVTVLDVSAKALEAARRRLGRTADRVKWIVADITTAELPLCAFALWHDRAVFHFMVRAEDRAAYVAAVLRTVKPGGHVIVATFAEDGPLQCSGLPVVRYRPDELHAEFGEAFTLLAHQQESHRTPAGKIQRFVYCACRKGASPGLRPTGAKGLDPEAPPGSGDLLALQASGVLSAGCVAGDIVAATWTDLRPDPLAGDGYFYLVRAENPCGSGDLGPGLEPLQGLACP